MGKLPTLPWTPRMEPHQPRNPLHGVTLQALLTELVEKFG
jgi:uncharacterized protein (DUF2132 family)